MRDANVWVVGVCVLGLLAVPARGGYIIGWGDDSTGQIDVPSGDDYVAVAAGRYHSLAIRADGSLVAWGMNSDGQCDVPAGSDFIDIAAGEFHSIALHSNGIVEEGGVYPPASGGQPPSQMPAGSFIDIDAVEETSVGIFTDGSLAVWGYGAAPPEGNNFIAVSAGGRHALALRHDDSVASWGDNNWGQCDVPHIDDFVAISAGGSHSLGLKTDGSLIAWGMNLYEQIDVPEGEAFVAISAGSAHNLALQGDGTIAAWGWNLYGQCDVPVLPDTMRYAAISAGEDYSLAVVEEIPEPTTLLLVAGCAVFVALRRKGH